MTTNKTEAEFHARRERALAAVRRQRDQLLVGRDEARAQLAALHAAASGISLVMVDGLPCIRGGAVLDSALSDLATAAADHEARIRADERTRALREAADVCERLSEAVRALADGGDEDEAREMSAEWLASTASDLRAMADESAVDVP